MKWLYEALVKLSVWSASRRYGEEVIQVDIHLKSGRKILIMDKDEQDKLVRTAQVLSKEWTQDQVDDLRKAILKIREGEK